MVNPADLLNKIKELKQLIMESKNEIEQGFRNFTKDKKLRRIEATKACQYVKVILSVHDVALNGLSLLEDTIYFILIESLGDRLGGKEYEGGQD